MYHGMQEKLMSFLKSLKGSKMKINKLNTTIEDLIAYYDAKKYRYPDYDISSIESARYWRYDGVVTGLTIAWKVFNNIKGDYKDE